MHLQIRLSDNRLNLFLDIFDSHKTNSLPVPTLFWTPHILPFLDGPHCHCSHQELLPRLFAYRTAWPVDVPFLARASYRPVYTTSCTYPAALSLFLFSGLPLSF
jgi:hypothetical protein